MYVPINMRTFARVDLSKGNELEEQRRNHHSCFNGFAINGPRMALKTSFRIDHHRFVLLAVDQRQGDASSSIDSSVQLVLLKKRSKTGYRFLRPFWNCLLGKTAKWFTPHPLSKLKKLFAIYGLPRVWTFNTLATTLGRGITTRAWLFAESWLKRLPPEAVSGISPTGFSEIMPRFIKAEKQPAFWYLYCSVELWNLQSFLYGFIVLALLVSACSPEKKMKRAFDQGNIRKW